MKTLLIFVNAVIISVIVAAIGVPREKSIDLVPPDPRPAQLIDLLPESTVAAIEVRNLASRWEEIRDLDAVAQMQDRLLPAVGMNVDDLPRIVGDEAMLALATSADGKRIVPLALLRPPGINTASNWIRSRPGVVLHREDDTLWVARVADARELERLARSNGYGPDLHVREVAAQLPDGGLVRGWIDPDALRRLLLDRVPGVWPVALDLLSASVAAELEAVRFAGFRRDLQPSGVVTDAVVAYEPEVLPAEVAAGLAAPPGPAVLPAALPPGVAAMLSFRTQNDATLPWLRFVADSDSRGPLRNLGFWIDEIEERTGLDLERDLLDPMGERGWLALLDGGSTGSWGWVAMIESEDRPASRAPCSICRGGGWSTLGAGRSDSSFRGTVRTRSKATRFTGEPPGRRSVRSRDLRSSSPTTTCCSVAERTRCAADCCCSTRRARGSRNRITSARRSP